ncbi:conjugal transfer protein TraD [Chryseobacterium defluvii]|uniref:Conjugal transfer protein TraD n=1 Tax=Chryseobacterium defluvii TaxID=160396 RepID=A0A495SNZ8_9FLAO|nr:conjugal transfer protein TraD [Chryseobacterium defluvii]RKT01796.1 hypothetical protein BCF58_1021 [Chryseobacterium defluvii]
MEILILSCLVIIIVLLIDSKINQKADTSTHLPVNEKRTNCKDIIGATKSDYSQFQTNDALKEQIAKSVSSTPTFEIETDQKMSELKEKASGSKENVESELNAEEEEAIWSDQDFSEDDIGFTTGVTLDELSTVGAILQNEDPEPALEKKAVEIVRKIQGTELLSLLEQQIEGASKRIAVLLDKSHTENSDSGPPLSKSNFNDFDIGQFV